MARRSLADVLPKLVRPKWRSVHEVTRVGGGYVCLANACSFASKELGAVSEHVARNQYVVLEGGAETFVDPPVDWKPVAPDTRGSEGEVESR